MVKVGEVRVKFVAKRCEVEIESVRSVGGDCKVCIIRPDRFDHSDRHADGDKPAAGLLPMAINPQRVYRQYGKIAESFSS